MSPDDTDSTILSLWDAVNNLTRLRPSKHERYRVTIFGSARAREGTFVYEETRRVARSLTEIRISLPFEQEANAFVTQVYEHRTFFTRLHHFVLASDAFVVTPGGIGTVLETMMVWQLLQVRQLRNTPLVLVGRMWRELVEWAQVRMLDPRLELVSRADLAIPRCVDTGTEAIELIRADHDRWLRALGGDGEWQDASSP